MTVPKVIYSLLVTVLFVLISCKPNEINTNYDGEHIFLIKSGIEKLDDSTRKLTLKDVSLGQFKNNFIPNPHYFVSYRISNNNHWVKFPILLKANDLRYLECNSGMVEYIEFYLLDAQNKIIASDTIKWNSKSSERSIRTWRNVFPIQVPKSGQYTMYVKTFKNNGSLQLPFMLWNVQEFYHSQYYRSLYYGFIIGVMVIITILAFSIFINIKDVKFLYYSMYIFFVLIWRFWIEGILQEVFLDSLPDLVYPFYGNIPMVCTIICILLFYREFVLKTFNKYGGVYQKWFKYIIITDVLLLTLSFVSKGKYEMYLILYYSYYSFGAIITLSLLFTLIHGLIQKNTNALVYALSTLPFLLTSTYTSLANNGFVNHSFLFFDNLLWSVFFEIVILTFALGVEFKNIMLQRRLLLQEINVKDRLIYHQENSLKEEKIARMQAEAQTKEERERLSRDLHDSMGSELSNIIYQIDFLTLMSKKLKYDSIILHLDHMRKVTRMSLQQLRNAIWVLHKEKITWEEFVSKIHSYFIEQSGVNNTLVHKIHLSENLSKEEIPYKITINVFRILQEAIVNVLKHANASFVDVYINKTKDGVEIKIKDNGTGFNLEKNHREDSNGLKNMSYRANDINGTFDIESNSLGTTITLLIKNNHEKI